MLWSDAAAYHTSEHGYPGTKASYSPPVARLIDAAISFGAVQVAGAHRMVSVVRAGEGGQALDGVDVLAFPTTPCLAPGIEEMRASDTTFRMLPSAAVIDFTGQPAIAVPCGLSKDGLPASISFVARRWDERSALRAARAWEQLCGTFATPSV